MRRTAAPLAGAALLLALAATACRGSDGQSGVAKAGIARAPASPAALTETETHRLLEDTWVTPIVTRTQVVRSLRDAGFAEYADSVAGTQPYPVAYNLRFTDGAYTLRTAQGLQPDQGTWELDGDRLVLLPADCPCRLDFAWQLDGDRLALELVHDSSPTVDGVPDAAYARALYSTVPLTRFSAAP